MTEPEEWNSTGWSEPPEGSIPLAGRIELMGVNVGVGDTAALVDPDDATSERPAGVENVPLVALDLIGHLHLSGQCVPSQTPYLITPVALDELIGGLIEAREALDAQYPHRERGARQ
jgi:hypothetical protein